MLFKSLNIYCERIDASFWSEPVNALTNIYIFMAGFLGYRLISKRYPTQARKHALVASALAMVTGVGSFLFHTFANVLTMWLDIIPIILFQIVSINFYLQFIFKRTLSFRIIFLISFVGLSLFLGTPQFKVYFNGSMLYFPSIVTLIGFGLICFKFNFQRVGHFTLTGIAIFIISIMARSFDMQICEAFPLGTHFIWHSLNGVLIYFLMLAMNDFINLSSNSE